MSTTSIIVEMLIIGFFTALWLFLFCLRLSFFDIQEIKSIAPNVGIWSTSILFIAAAVFYQLGLLTNTFSHKITKRFANREIRDQIVPGKIYENVKATVWQKGSAEIIKHLELNLSFVRLSRAGIINFLLIAIAFFTFGNPLALLGIVSLLICIGCIPLWRSVYGLYYKRMRFAYEVIAESEINSMLPKPDAYLQQVVSDAAPNKSLKPTAR